MCAPEGVIVNTFSQKLTHKIQVARQPLSWGVARRVLGRWRWYGCSSLVGILAILALLCIVSTGSQFAISGETESFGSNNLMGQWLKAIGGFTVERIGTFYLRNGMVWFDAHYFQDYYPR